MDSENNLLLVVIVALLLLIFVTSNRRGGWRRKNEHMVSAANATQPREAKSASFNPRLMQPQISEQVVDDNFIPLPQTADYPWSKNGGAVPYGETDILDDGAMGNLGLNFNMCSKSCCSTGAVWPTPHSLSPDDFVLMSDKEFLPTNLTCNNGWQDSGCACVTRDQSRFLRHRGNNSSGGDL